MKSVLVTITLLLSSCTFAQQANSDAEEAIRDNDFRLYKLSVRGNVFPGIAVSERATAAALCGSQILKGTGDVIRDNEEKQKRQELTDYASEYNRIVYAACRQTKTVSPKQ